MSDTETPDAAPAQRKLSLQDQIIFVNTLYQRCCMSAPELRGTPAGQAWLLMRPQEIHDLKTIADTLMIFEFYEADAYVRDRVKRRGRRPK